VKIATEADSRPGKYVVTLQNHLTSRFPTLNIRLDHGTGLVRDITESQHVTTLT
jgi:hypothetical protein